MLLAYDAYLKKCVELEIAKLKNDGHINDNIISYNEDDNEKPKSNQRRMSSYYTKVSYNKLLESNTAMLDLMHSKIFGLAQTLNTSSK